MINGTCMSASTSRGAMGFFRANFVFRASRIFFFSPPKSEYFSATMGIRLLKKKKKIPHPLEVNWSVPKDKKS